MSVPTSPSANHPNRYHHNWLIYDIIDQNLVDNRELLVGCLYDLGSGESPYRDFFLNHVDKYVAVDWTSSLHDTQANIVADLNNPLEIESEVADVIVCLSVLEHLHSPDVALAEAFRILKPGGSILIQVPWQWKIHEAPHDFFRYTPFGFEYLMSQCGFSNILVCPQGGFFTMMALKMNYFVARFIRGPRLLRWLIRWPFRFVWFFSQKTAPILDKFDEDWAAETVGFFVTARKL